MRRTITLLAAAAALLLAPAATASPSPSASASTDGTTAADNSGTQQTRQNISVSWSLEERERVCAIRVKAGPYDLVDSAQRGQTSWSTTLPIAAGTSIDVQIEYVTYPVDHNADWDCSRLAHSSASTTTVAQAYTPPPASEPAPAPPAALEPSPTNPTPPAEPTPGPTIDEKITALEQAVAALSARIDAIEARLALIEEFNAGTGNVSESLRIVNALETTEASNVSWCYPCPTRGDR